MFNQAHDFTVDTAIQLKDAGAVAATAVTTVGGSAASYDVGSASYAAGRLIIDVTACEVDSADDAYRLQLQGSTTSNFSTAYELCTRILGHATATGNAINTAPVGRHVLHWDNVAQVNATTGETAPLRYIRLRTIVTGAAVVTGINYTAHLAPGGAAR